MRPLATVEKPSFIKLVEGLTNNKVKMPDRRRITFELEKRFENHKQDLINIMKKQANICTTCDLWTCNNRAYLGMYWYY